MMKRSSICFVSHYAHAVFTGKSRQFGGEKAFGGAEVQQLLVARGLAARGFDVRFVSYASGPAREEEVDGVRFWTFPPPTDDSARHRGRVYRNLWRAMRRADAGVYYQRCAGALTGMVGAFARLHRRAFLFSVANDRDLDGRFIRGASLAQALAYRAGLRMASAVVVQTRHQAGLLREGWRREGVIIPSACRLPADPLPPVRERKNVLWIGSLLSKKRPELLVALADRLPNVGFIMIAPVAGSAREAEKMVEEIRKRANVTYNPGVSYPEIPSYYRCAAILVSTSLAEGFPNVFLEAWANRLPVVSLGFDPDGVICEKKLGAHVNSIEDLAERVGRLLREPEERRLCGERGESYVRDHHLPETVVTRYEDLIRRVVRQDRPG